MSDNSQLALKEPEQVDWEKIGGSNYTPPPPAKDQAGKNIVYFGQLPNEIKVDETDDDGYRTYVLDPIKLVKNNNGADGYIIRFGSVSLKPWKNGNNSAALLIKAAGVNSKPQKTTEYDQVVRQLGKRVVPFTVDWEARNKDTGEKVRGYDNFPDDPSRPGMKKSILKAGDTYKDENGADQVVKSEVLFANARVRFFEAGKK